AVVDAVLRVETPAGPVWRRYNHDGYGETRAGRPYQGHGVGRAWPLLAGERGHYELGAGRDAAPTLKTMERLANACGLLPEQVWDEPDRPARHLVLGQPTGGAMPLMWAHAEYIKLLRSRADGRVFDRIAPVAERYPAAAGGGGRRALEVWKFTRRVRRVPAGATLRVQAEAPFVLHVTQDGWASARDLPSQSTRLGIHYVDLAAAGTPTQFTFYWPDVR